MTPVVAIGNAISIVFAGIIVSHRQQDVERSGRADAGGQRRSQGLEISPEMQAKRDKIDVKNLGIGLFVSNSFFAWGFIVAKLWSKLVPSVSIHAYAWMIITVAICKIFNLLPENIEVACYQWFQFVMKNLTTTLLVGIGLCYLSLDTVIESFSVTYLILCLLSPASARVLRRGDRRRGSASIRSRPVSPRAVHGEYGRHRRRSGSFPRRTAWSSCPLRRSRPVSAARSS